MRKPIIFTHVNVDVDAATSIWFLLRFILRVSLKDVELVFKPANWDGSGMEESDWALDIEADGRGVKGEFRHNRTHSCLDSLYRYHDPQISREDLPFVEDLVKFVDKHDSSGKTSLDSLRLMGEGRFNALFLNSLLHIFWGYKTSNNDFEVVEKFIENLDNHLDLEKQQRTIRDNISQVSSDKVVLVVDKNLPSEALGRQGKKIKIYQDGCNLGVVVIEPNLRGPEIVEILRPLIEEAGEEIIDSENGWFVHPSYRLICRGSRVNPVNSPSRVDPEKILEILREYVENRESQRTLLG